MGRRERKRRKGMRGESVVVVALVAEGRGYCPWRECTASVSPPILVLVKAAGWWQASRRRRRKDGGRRKTTGRQSQRPHAPFPATRHPRPWSSPS